MVTEKLEGCHSIHTEYPLLPGDVLTRDEDGTYRKHTGVGIWGFELTPDQESTLKPVAGQIVMCGWGDYEHGDPAATPSLDSEKS
jgi:hypothetical protein